MGKDLGTYHLRVEFTDGQGFIFEWSTANRYTRGRGSCSPLDAKHIPATWENEGDVFNTMLYMFTEGNYSCDCNRSLFLIRARQGDENEELDCGDTLVLKRLTAIRPDMTEKVLLDDTK